jgi:transcriptional regulator with XRE-family HTH domain
MEVMRTRKLCENRYRVCREAAGLTQESAAELLCVSVRTLSDYENGHSKVPDDTVDMMAGVYQAPLLAWWHIKTQSPLGKYLPDLQEPATNGDMAFQAILASDDLGEAAMIIKSIMGDGVIDESEREMLGAAMGYLQSGSGKALSSLAYGKGISGQNRTAAKA